MKSWGDSVSNGIDFDLVLVLSMSWFLERKITVGDDGAVPVTILGVAAKSIFQTFSVFWVAA